MQIESIAQVLGIEEEIDKKLFKVICDIASDTVSNKKKPASAIGALQESEDLDLKSILAGYYLAIEILERINKGAFSSKLSLESKNVEELRKIGFNPAEHKCNTCLISGQCPLKPILDRIRGEWRERRNNII